MSHPPYPPPPKTITRTTPLLKTLPHRQTDWNALYLLAFGITRTTNVNVCPSPLTNTKSYQLDFMVHCEKYMVFFAKKYTLVSHIISLSVLGRSDLQTKPRIEPEFWQTTANVFVRATPQFPIHILAESYQSPGRARRQSVESGIMCVCVDIIIMVWFMFIVCFMQPYTCSCGVLRPCFLSSCYDSYCYSYSYSYSYPVCPASPLAPLNVITIQILWQCEK